LNDAHTAVNRREHVRVDIKVQGVYAEMQPDHTFPDVGAWKNCLVVNLSNRGLQIAATVEQGIVGVDDNVMVRFKLGAEYTLLCHVVWADTLGTLQRFGVKFEDIDDMQHERLVWELVRLTVKRKRRK